MTARDLVILGNINVDLILGPLDGWPGRGMEVLVEGLQWRVGGNAGNAAAACAALGTDVAVISTAGSDLAGTWLRQQLPAKLLNWLPHTGPTSVTVALSHSDGERSFITQLGHLASLDWPSLRPHVPLSRFVLLAGAFLTPALRRQYPELLTHFGRAGTQVALDMGWPDGGYTPELRREVLDWLPQVHHLLINDLEALALSGEPELRRAADQLASRLHPDGTLVIKCGPGGVLVQRAGHVTRHQAPAVQVCDTVGAGDIWNAAYLHALSRQESTSAAADFAVGTASTAVSTHPRRYLAPTP